MKYYSTNHQSPVASLEEAVVKGLASDKGLFMPEAVKMLPEEFYDNIEHLSFQEIAYRVADAFFGEDVPADTLKQIVYDTLSFDVPAVKVKDNIYSLELFHGPTLAFKDVGGRFMARLLGYFIKKEGQKQVNVLVATIGKTTALSTFRHNPIYTRHGARTGYQSAGASLSGESIPVNSSCKEDCRMVFFFSLSKA